jgi:hypothetical protein
MATETAVVNMALSKIGSKRLVNLDTDTSVEAEQCNLHYDQTRDALLRSYWWNFAAGRLQLVASWVTGTVYTTDQYAWSSSILYKCSIAHTASALFATDLAAVKWVAVTDRPEVQFGYRYDLPADFLRFREFYDNVDSYAIEQGYILTDETDVGIVYTKKITNSELFDPLFIDVLVVSLAIKMVMPLSQDKTLYDRLYNELANLLRHVRLVEREEANSKASAATWNDARQMASSSLGA